jgi:multiple sugar transport system substrate-binding protein
MLKATGAAAAVATGAGAGLFGGKAPAFAQSRAINVVAWSHFIPDADRKMEQYAKDFEAATKVKVTCEFINANDIPARATAAVESGQGSDIFQLQWNQAQLYAPGLSDHSKLAAELGADKDYAFMKESVEVGKVWRGIPFNAIGNAFVYRKDWWAAQGLRDPNTPGIPFTWDLFLAAGKKLKKAGQPIGFTLGHTFGDAPAWCYPILWSFGGREVDEHGKVAINTKETRFAVEYVKEFWNAAADEGGLAWDDTSNNRAFYAETISATQNGASIYIQSKFGKQRPDLKDKMGHFVNPLGTHGRYHVILSLHHCIMKGSKQQEAAADWIRFLHDKKRYEEYFVVQGGYGLSAGPSFESHPIWKQDPVLEPFSQNAKYGRNFGWPGPYNQKASEVQAKYIIIDLFAEAVKGGGLTTAQSIAKAEKELKLVYERA